MDPLDPEILLVQLDLVVLWVQLLQLRRRLLLLLLQFHYHRWFQNFLQLLSFLRFPLILGLLLWHYHQRRQRLQNQQRPRLRQP